MNWVYQLQNVDPAALGKVKADVKVIDYSRDGTDAGRFNRQDVMTMRGCEPWQEITDRTPAPIKRVLSYLSIGEAETYRFYWQQVGNSPWLSDENPDWPGNYKVQFWSKGWKNIIFAYLDDILDAGFDGVYLDIIDAYEYWQERGVDNADHYMVEFVREIAAHARSRNPFFWVVPQNGEGLLQYPDYRKVISALAKEDLLYGIDGDGVLNGPDATGWGVKHLNLLRADQKPVLLVEYIDKPSQVLEVMKLAKTYGYSPLFAKRALDTIPHPVKVP